MDIDGFIIVTLVSIAIYAVVSSVISFLVVKDTNNASKREKDDN